MDGNLLRQLVTLAGLPENEASTWMSQALRERQIDPSNVSLDQIRDVLADLLQDLILSSESEN